jgi:hypothetical protein
MKKLQMKLYNKHILDIIFIKFNKNNIYIYIYINMLDYLILKGLLKLTEEKKTEEKKTEEHYNTSTPTPNIFNIILSIIAGGIAVVIFFIFVSFLAAVLSWRCNSQANYPLSIKLVCSLNAFSYGTIYLIYYAVMSITYKDALCVINPQ